MLLKIDRCVSLITGFKDKLYHLKGIRPLRYPFKAWYSRKNQWYPIISGFPWLFQVYMSKIAVHDRPPLKPTRDFLVLTESISINSGQKCPTSTNLSVFNLVEEFRPIFKFSQFSYFFSLISLLFNGRYGFIPPSPYSPAFQTQKILFRAFFELFSHARFGSWSWWRHHIYENQVCDVILAIFKSGSSDIQMTNL